MSSSSASTLMPPPPAPLARPQNHPRRSRVNTPSSSTLPLSPPYSPESSCHSRKMSLSKGATFCESSSPPTEDDPVLCVRFLARRSPTSPKSSLQSLISDKEDVALKSIQAFEQSFSGARGNRLSTHRLPDHDQQLTSYRTISSPLDEGLGSSISPSSEKGLARSFDRVLNLLSDRDSGLGTSIDDHQSMKESANKLRRTSEEDGLVKDLIQDANQSDTTPAKLRLRGGSEHRSLRVATSKNRSAVTQSISPPSPHNTRPHRLSNLAHSTIHKNILEPLLQEDRFDVFHPLVTSIGSKSNKSVRCLRDLEQSLIFEPIVSHPPSTNLPSGTALKVDTATKAYQVALQAQLAVSHHLYRTFGEFTIQLVLDTYQHLSEADQRRESDRPYSSGYFLDLVQQVGQLAASIGQARQAQASRQAGDSDSEDEMAYSLDDPVTIEGGIAETGQFSELVRWKNGKPISLRTNEPYVGVPALKRQHSNESLDDDVARSMARRKKNAEPRIVELKCSDKSCGKIFNRKCDLAKHEKTHSRPFKCRDPTCKYHDLGLPTEKERDRHYNDKHASNPVYYKCDYCEFKTKRESNCKQHMEKKHDWSYERVKGNGKKIKTTPGATPKTPSMPYTPSEQSPAPSYYDDASSVQGSHADISMVSPYENPLPNFDPYPTRIPAGQPLFPRPNQQQYIQAANDFGFETMAQNPVYTHSNQYTDYMPHINTNMSPQMMRTPITPAYSAISPYAQPINSMAIHMDFQGTGAQWDAHGLPTPNSNLLQPHSRNPSLSYESPINQQAQDFMGPMASGMEQDRYISHSQLPHNDDFSFNDPILSTGYHQSNMADPSLFPDMTIKAEPDFQDYMDQFMEEF